MKRCKCGAELAMIKTVGGRWMPAEAEIFTFIDLEGNVRKGRIVHWGRCKDEGSYRHQVSERKPEDPSNPPRFAPQQEPCHHAGPPAPMCVCGHYAADHFHQTKACRVCSCDRFLPIPRGPDEGQEGGP